MFLRFFLLLLHCMDTKKYLFIRSRFLVFFLCYVIEFAVDGKNSFYWVWFMGWDKKFLFQAGMAASLAACVCVCVWRRFKRILERVLQWVKHLQWCRDSIQHRLKVRIACVSNRISNLLDTWWNRQIVLHCSRLRTHCSMKLMVHCQFRLLICRMH